MIKELHSTNAASINRSLVHMRADGGAIALGRVLTLMAVTDESNAERAIEDANYASREHPCRVLVAVAGPKRGAARLDAQIRVGGDAGASEVIVLRSFGPLVDHVESVIVPLLLPDAPIVAWWPAEAPDVPSTAPVGRLAQRRIVDSSATSRPNKALVAARTSYAPGDTDLAWSRVTLWRAVLAAALDEAGWHGIESITVTGGSDSPSSDLMAAWLSFTLRKPVTRARSRPGSGLISVRMSRRDGEIDLVRPDDEDATLAVPGKPARRIALPKRLDRDCLAEELRRLDPDDVYAEVVTKGLARLDAKKRPTERDAERSGAAPSRQASKDRTAQPVRARRTVRGPERTAAAAPRAKRPPSGSGAPESESRTPTEAT